MPYLDVPVLGPAPFGDVHARHDFEAGGDLGAQLERNRVLFDQLAVDPVAQPHHALHGFDMDVRSALVDRLGDDEVDELDNLRPLLVGQFVAFLLFVLALDDVKLFHLDRPQQLVHLLHAGGIISFDRRVDAFFGRDDGLYFLARFEFEVVGGPKVGRVGHRNGEDPFFLEQRDDFIAPRHVFGDELDQRPVEVEIVKHDMLYVKMRAQDIDQLFLGNVSQLYQAFAQLHFRFFLLFQSGVELLLGNEALVDENFADSLFLVELDLRAEDAGELVFGEIP